MNLHVIPAGPIATNAYLLTNSETGEAVLIDAPNQVLPAVAQLLKADKCRLVELWITHGHWDHMQGVAEVVRATGARVRAHPADRVLLETPHVMEPFSMGLAGTEPASVDEWLTTPGEFRVIGENVEVRHVPGHSDGNVVFYVPSLGWAFVGDALFRDSVGRTDLPGGDFELLRQSIQHQIYTLPEATLVYPGHGPATTVGREKAENPYVRG